MGLYDVIDSELAGSRDAGPALLGLYVVGSLGVGGGHAFTYPLHIYYLPLLLLSLVLLLLGS